MNVYTLRKAIEDDARTFRLVSRRASNIPAALRYDALADYAESVARMMRDIETASRGVTWPWGDERRHVVARTPGRGTLWIKG